MKFVLLLLLVFVPLCADIVPQARLGDEYLEAHDYDEALNTYQNALSDTEQGWQQAALQYNIGNVQLLSGKSGDALQSYDQTAQSGPFLELAARIAYNRAVAEMERAKSLPDEKDTPALETVRIGLWREALEAIGEAEDALCARDKAIGAKECPEVSNVKALRQIAQQELALILQKNDAQRIQEDALPQLYVGATGLLDLLKNMDSRYQQIYIDSAKAWEPLWESVGKKVTSSDFSQAHDSFQEASAQVSKGEYLPARQALEHTISLLQKVTAAVYGTKNLDELVQILQDRYAIALARESIDKNDVQTIAQLIEQIKNKGGDVQFLMELNQATLDAIDKDDQKEALMMVQGAKIALGLLSTKNVTTLKDILQQLVENEHGLLTINREYQKNPKEKLAQMLTRLQGNIVQEARNFPQAMQAEQKKQWERGTFQSQQGIWEQISSLRWRLSCCQQCLRNDSGAT